MRLHGELLELRDCNGVRLDTEVHGWIKHLKHWRYRGTAEWKKSSSETDMPYVRTFEEAVYERKLSELIASLPVRNVRPEMYGDVLPAYLSIQLVVL